jgi:AAA15 family ATPase/GTPase
MPTVFPSLQSQLMLFEIEDDLVDKVRGLFRQADFGIVDIKRSETDLPTANGRTIKRTRYLLQHEEGNDESWIPLNEESDGTQTLFRLAPRIFRALDTGGLVLIDELESSLHPHLATTIVNLFNCPKTNRANAQLIFTTHDTNLLGNTTGEPALRRDQVWFTEKDSTGATTLYPLTNYKPRNVENLERGYLQGRYGAIPFLGGLKFSELQPHDS